MTAVSEGVGVQQRGEPTLIEDGLVDQIAAGLLGRYYGSVADPAGLITGPLSDEVVVDLRGPRPRALQG